MNQNARLISDEQHVLTALKEAKQNQFSTVMVHIAEGRVVFIEVSKKIRF